MTREEMVEARDAAPTLAQRWAWCDAIRIHDEDAARIRAIWVDGPDSEAARAARACGVCGYDGPGHNAHICGRIER